MPEDQEVDIQIDPEYEPEEVNVTDDSIPEKSNESSKLLAENLETSPMMFQVKCKCVTELVPQQKDIIKENLKDPSNN